MSTSLTTAAVRYFLVLFAYPKRYKGLQGVYFGVPIYSIGWFLTFSLFYTPIYGVFVLFIALWPIYRVRKMIKRLKNPNDWVTTQRHGPFYGLRLSYEFPVYPCETQAIEL
jgi:hypothetical protein